MKLSLSPARGGEQWRPISFFFFPLRSQIKNREERGEEQQIEDAARAGQQRSASDERMRTHHSARESVFFFSFPIIKLLVRFFPSLFK